jgi:hypothetical protein
VSLVLLLRQDARTERAREREFSERARESLASSVPQRGGSIVNQREGSSVHQREGNIVNQREGSGAGSNLFTHKIIHPLRRECQLGAHCSSKPGESFRWGGVETDTDSDSDKDTHARVFSEAPFHFCVIWSTFQTRLNPTPFVRSCNIFRLVSGTNQENSAAVVGNLK